MFAAVPVWLTEIAAWVGAITIISAGGTAIVTRKPFRWLGRTLVGDPLSRWFRHQISESETGKIVRHHLGKNGSTPSISSRLSRVEVALLIHQGRELFTEEEDIEL
jgi:hypothetical protein